MDRAKTAGAVALAVVGLVFLCVGGLLGAFGVLYVLAAHAPDAADPGARLGMGVGMIGVGLVLWSAAAVGSFMAWRWMRPPPEQKVTIRQEVELSGDIDLSALTCQKCNATLDKSAITVKEGAILISCPYCGATYQIVEEPKW